MGGTLGPFRPAAVRRSFRAGDPLCVRRLHGVARHRPVMGKAGILSRESPRLCRASDGERPSACGGGGVYGGGAPRRAPGGWGGQGGGGFYRRLGGGRGGPGPPAGGWRR